MLGVADEAGVRPRAGGRGCGQRVGGCQGANASLLLRTPRTGILGFLGGGGRFAFHLWRAHDSDSLNNVKVMSASEVSRGFSAVLDEAEHGETIVITRAGRRVATITAVSSATWGSLRAALRDWTPRPDADLENDMRAARAAVTLDEDPWQSA